MKIKALRNSIRVLLVSAMMLSTILCPSFEAITAEAYNGAVYTSDPITITSDFTTQKECQVKYQYIINSNNKITLTKFIPLTKDKNGIIRQFDYGWTRDWNDVSKKLSNGRPIIPESINGFTVTGLGNGLFRRSLFKEIFIPKTITEIGDYTFAECPYLHRIYTTEMSNVRTIGYRAFCDSTCLQIISSFDKRDIKYAGFYNATSIGADAFWGTHIDYIQLSPNMEFIGNNAFGNINCNYFGDYNSETHKKFWCAIACSDKVFRAC